MFNKKVVLGLALVAILFGAVSAEAASHGHRDHSRHNKYSQENLVSKNAAIKTAYEHAGVKADDVSICQVKLDKHKGQPVYEIEFIVGRTEYEFEIDAITGAIVGLDCCPAQGPEAPHAGFIGVEKAKEIAFNEAGIKPATDVIMKKIELGRDDGLIVYELEFYHQNQKYEYKMEAMTGKVLADD